MVWIVAHLWIRPGRVEEFMAFEEAALGIFRDHGGEVISRFRPETGQFEIHVLRCPSLAAFGAFRLDDRLIRLGSLRDSAIERTEVFVGEEL